MKKIFKRFAILSLATVLAGMAAPTQAVAQKAKAEQSTQSLTGTWVADMKSMMDNSVQYKKSDVIFTFSGSNVKIGIDIQAERQQGTMAIDMGIRVNGKAAYKKDGRYLKIKSTDTKPSVDFYKCKLVADEATKAALAERGITQQSLKKMIQQNMNLGEYTNTLRLFHGDLYIVEHTATTLVLSDDSGTKISFTKKK